MKLMGSVKKSNVEFYELINILGDIATNTIANSKMFAQGLIVSYRKKKAISFEKELLKASNELRNNEINNDSESEHVDSGESNVEQ